MKKIGLVVIALILLVAGGLLYLHSNLDYLIKSAIEKYGTAAAQAEVRLDNVKLSVTSGEGLVKGLTVGNPKGFSSSNALGMGMISVKLDTGSITGNGPIVIREVIIDRPAVDFEATNTGNTNLQTLEKNIAANAHSEAVSAHKGAAQERKIVISNLIIRGGQIGINHPLLDQPLIAPLPAIHLTNIGKDGGATPAQVADQILSAIISSAGQTASNVLARNLGNRLKDAGGNAVKNAIGGSGLGSQINGLLGR